MGLLADFLAQPTAPEPEPVERSTEFDREGNYTQAMVLERQPRSVPDLLNMFGHDEDAFTVEGNIGVSHRELVDGRVVSTYRYKLVERQQAVDVDKLVDRAAKATRHVEQGSAGDTWFVFQAGDQQIGKRSRDGSTEEIIECYLQSVFNALQEFEANQRFGIAGVQLSFPGDCLEGSVSQGGKNAWLTQQTVPEQTRIFRRLLMHTVEQFAPLTDRLYVDVVNGNHDEAQRQFNTYPGDGWATESAIALDDALKLNQAAYGHVRVRVPDPWDGYMTVPVGDSLVTVVHGHQFGREANAMPWWKDQVFGSHNPTNSIVLQNGHFHEMSVHRAGDRVRVQSPTFDCGSDWYRQSKGVGNTRGGLTYLLRGGDVSRLSLV